MSEVIRVQGAGSAGAIPVPKGRNPGWAGSLKRVARTDFSVGVPSYFGTSFGARAPAGLPAPATGGRENQLGGDSNPARAARAHFLIIATILAP